jgi:hypothetical protein
MSFGEQSFWGFRGNIVWGKGVWGTGIVPILRTILVHFSGFGIMHQEKSGNPVTEARNEAYLST